MLWPLLWRAALAAALVAGGWHYGGRAAEHKLAEQQAQLIQSHADAVDALRAEERARESRSTEVEQKYETAKTELERMRARVPTRVVRVCESPANSGGMPVPGTAPGADGPGANSAQLPGAAGRDIGPALYGLADECDNAATRLNLLQEWNKAMAAPPRR